MFCLFVLFQQIIDYKNKAIQRRVVEANGAMALQPVEVLFYVKVLNGWQNIND